MIFQEWHEIVLCVCKENSENTPLFKERKEEENNIKSTNLKFLNYKCCQM